MSCEKIARIHGPSSTKNEVPYSPTVSGGIRHHNGNNDGLDDRNRRSVVRDSKITCDVAPGAVNVVGRVTGRVLLDIQELNDEGWSLNAVCVRLACFRIISCEGEMDLIKADLVQSVQLCRA